MPDPKLHTGSMSQENNIFMVYAGLRILTENIEKTAKNHIFERFSRKNQSRYGFLRFFKTEMKSTGSISPTKIYFEILSTPKYKVPWVERRGTYTLYLHVRFDAHKKPDLVR